MKLKRVVISGFRSIKGREELLIDQNVTILIGANDHGKSNLLEAIRRLNDEVTSTDDDRNWDLLPDQQPRIEWIFSVEKNELDNYIEQDDVPLLSIVQGLNRQSESTSELSEQELSDNEYFPLSDNNELVYYKEGIDSKLKILCTPYPILIIHENALLKIRPKVEEFFKPLTTNLKDEVTLVQLTTPEYETMQGIFQLAGIWEQKDILFTQNDRTSKMLKQASEKLTMELNGKWNQGKDLNWKLEHAGTNGDHIKILIEDPAVKNTFIRPSLRSSGFQTFFVLSMMVNARTNKSPDNSYIFLFDEPGIYLHPNAQLDLQRSFEAISDKTQIIYSTHSLFLVNKNYPERNRVISKTKEGTKIDLKPFQKNWKSVRDSLGILFSNNFLIAEKTLLVEGPSDVIYILSAIKTLKAKGEIDIDLNDFSIVDAGSSENYVAISKVMLAEGRNIVALLDGDTAGKSIETKLKKVCDKELNERKLIILPLGKNRSIEDDFAEPDLLKKSIKTLAEEQVINKTRKYVPGFEIEKALSDIKGNTEKSLGLTIKEVTSQWFDSGEALSKLSIALIYENLAKEANTNPPSSAFDKLKAIKEKMSLKGEKSTEIGVFGELRE